MVHVAQQERFGPRIDRNADPREAERRLWLSLNTQPGYGVAPQSLRTPMGKIGNQAADEKLWTTEAHVNRQLAMFYFLQQHFGPEKRLRVTSVVKDGEHRLYRKMDVVPAGTTTWEELAAAATYAGFWVHAEGVRLGGKLWPLSKKATGPHLDLYLRPRTIGDFPSVDEPKVAGPVLT
jgi:hypothetical protein